MNYSVNIYGGGDVKQIIKDLRFLAQKLEDNQHDDLTGDGFEAETLTLELSSATNDDELPKATETVVCTEDAWKAYMALKK
jgi:hypothetical protein